MLLAGSLAAACAQEDHPYYDRHASSKYQDLAQRHYQLANLDHRKALEYLTLLDSLNCTLCAMFEPSLHRTPSSEP